MNKYLVRNFKWIENLGKVPAKVYRLEALHIGYMFYQNKNVSITLKLRYICKKCCRIR